MSPSKVMLDVNEDTAVADFLEILEEHRKNCERQGKYVEAEIAKNRLDELKLHEENRRRVCRRYNLVVERRCLYFSDAVSYIEFNTLLMCINLTRSEKPLRHSKALVFYFEQAFNKNR